MSRDHIGSLAVDGSTLRRTLVGASVGGGLFAVVSVFRSFLAPGPVWTYWEPVGVMLVIGATVGGLVGPMVGQILLNRRMKRESRGGASAPAGGSPAASASVRPPSSRQPFWLTLLVGLAVGWGVGTAWDRVWVGLALGVVMALLARWAFR